MKNKKSYSLPYSTQIEVVAIKGKQVFKKVIMVSEKDTIEKKKGFKYYFFQIGFSQFKTTETK